MRHLIILGVHLISTALRLVRDGGVRAVVAEDDCGSALQHPFRVASHPSDEKHLQLVAQPKPNPPRM